MRFTLHGEQEKLEEFAERIPRLWHEDPRSGEEGDAQDPLPGLDTPPCR